MGRDKRVDRESIQITMFKERKFRRVGGVQGTYMKIRCKKHIYKQFYIKDKFGRTHLIERCIVCNGGTRFLRKEFANQGVEYAKTRKQLKQEAKENREKRISELQTKLF